MHSGQPPLLNPKRYDDPSRFQVENLLREARRQRQLPDLPVPEVCLLDPVAEELHASGCRLVVSITSAGQIAAIAQTPYFVLIERAWRDEGTSLHYLPPSEWSHLRSDLAARLAEAFHDLDEPVLRGTSWTTDAPLRDTASTIAAANRAGIHAVEMEAAALYAYATARGRDVVCIAHVTNTMATHGDDFE
jgi:uridine phosphorylase